MKARMAAKGDVPTLRLRTTGTSDPDRKLICARDENDMKQAGGSLPRQFKTALALGVALLGAGIVLGQGQIPESKGVPDDWTHHHLVFSNPGTAAEALENGTYDRWVSVVSDPRYALQVTKRAAAANAELRPILPPASRAEAVTPEAQMQLSVDTDNSESRLPRGLMRAAPADSKGISAPRFPIPRWRRITQSNLRTDWSENLGSNATVGLGMFPAKYSFGVSSANCGSAGSPDFVVYNTGLAGSAGQASIVAYDNLYSGCSGTVPSVYWAYDTNGGAIVTSVVLSQDGSQIAFAQTTGTAASLVVLKWKASSSETPSAPAVLTSTGSYQGCTAPCMTQINFSGGANDSGSAVYYDYSSDTIYVGDDGGRLHKFTGVFNSTPAEAGSPWPVSVNTSGEGLASPVYDSTSGKVFVGDYLVSNAPNCATAGCGYLYSVNASTGAVVQSSRLDYIFGIADAPLVDSSAARVYAFVGADSGFQSSSSPCGKRVPCSGVFQFATNFSAGGSGTEARMGAGFELLLSGTFDNAYFNSANGSSPSGNLYVVGNTGAANSTLYQIPISANVMGAPNTGPALSTNYSNGFFAAGLQLTEVFTGSKDYIFTSVVSFGAPASCTSGSTEGCVMGFDVTSGSISGSTTPTGATTEAQGTSGITIDNIVTTAPTGASNIYYTPLGNQLCGAGGTGGCAIQISQATP